MRERLLLVAAVWFGALAGQVAAMRTAAYHGLFESLETSVMAGVLASLLLTAPTAACAVFFRSINPTRFVAGGTMLYALSIVVTHAFNPHMTLNWSSKIALILGAVALIFVCLRYLGTASWNRAGRITLAGMIAWILSTPIVAWIQSEGAVEVHPTLSLERIFEHPPKAVVILILDETSPEFLPLLTAGLENATHVLYATTSKAAGSDTIYAIPSMLTSQRHDGVSVCGPTQLCGANGFEMDKLRAAQPVTDVVGFWQPYCAIQGLRSCWRADAEQTDSPAFQLNLLMGLMLRLPLINHAFKIAQQDVIRDVYKHTSEFVTQHALRAPFWQHGGGLLYIHQLLPHPTGTGVKRELSGDYLANFRKAKDFVDTLNHRLQASFPGEYAFIITSDHPLRASMWCKNPVYASPKCLKENSAKENKVPFVVLAPKGISVKLPTENVGVFAPPSSAT